MEDLTRQRRVYQRHFTGLCSSVAFHLTLIFGKNTNMRFYADDTCIYYCVGKEVIQLILDTLVGLKC